MTPNNWMLAFASVITFLILFKVTEKPSCGCNKK